MPESSDIAALPVDHASARKLISGITRQYIPGIRYMPVKYVRRHSSTGRAFILIVLSIPRRESINVKPVKKVSGIRVH